MNEPPAYMDEEGRIIIIGFEPWNKVPFVEKGRAIPDKWKDLLLPNGPHEGRPD